MSDTTNGSDRDIDWNVLTSPWLDVMGLNAEPEVCSPMETLVRASEICRITATSPLDSFAAHRFLLTVLYWKANAVGGVERLRQSLLTGQLPVAVTAAIQGEAASFRIFDAERPFLQDPSAQNQKRKKSAGSLFAEFACGTNVAHFHHGDDANMRLCLRCATVGMLRLVPWSQSGGAGVSPAVHNAPPIMAMACGSTLAVTLGLNLVPLQGKVVTPKWSGHFASTNRTAAIPYMEAFTWNPRRVHLPTVEADGACWRCGRRGVQVVGPIVYEKNENTKSEKNGKKTIPFTWQDPSAYYGADSPYVTIKSYDERLAAVGQDLASLVESEASPPDSAVLKANPDHQGWRLVIPCTNPANNKTFDHRQIESTDLSPDTIRALVPHKAPPARQEGIDGWGEPPSPCTPGGASAFVRAALQLLTHADWAVLATAAYHQMHDSPAAFDLLSGLHWSLRNRRVPGLPSRNVAWLMLKLMAAAPSSARVLRDGARFCPLRELPKRQLDERRNARAARSPYPISLPRGQCLEAALRSALDRHLRRRTVAPIDWPALCHRLDQLLD